MSKTSVSGSKIARLLVSKRGFINNRHKTLLGLLLLTRQIEYQNQVFFKTYDLTFNQYNVLRILRAQYPKTWTMQDIKHRMMDKMSDVTRLVERLLGMGYLSRDINSFDKRVIDVQITPKGLGLMAEIDKKVAVLWAFESLSDKEIEQLVNLIEKILD